MTWRTDGIAGTVDAIPSGGSGRLDKTTAWRRPWRSRVAISGDGLCGFNGTMTAPSPSTARYASTKQQPVAAQQRDPIAGSNAELGQSAADLGDVVAQLAVGGLDAAADDRDMVGRMPVDDVCEIHRDPPSTGGATR